MASVCNGRTGTGTVVLLARIVDGGGAAIRPAHVSSIKYSLYDVDSLWPEQLTVVRGHHHVRLHIADVLFDRLQTGSPWSLDDLGYNFRHEIAFDRSAETPKDRPQYELRYEVAAAGGENAVLRFQLRGSTLDARY